LAFLDLDLTKDDITITITKYPDSALAKAKHIMHADLAATLFQREHHLASPGMSLILQEVREALPKLGPI
jgi:hypothetical protein